MRHIVIFILFIILSTSCSKQRTCICNITNEDNGVPQNYQQNFSVFGTKFEAENTCESYEYYEAGEERSCSLQ